MRKLAVMLVATSVLLTGVGTGTASARRAEVPLRGTFAMAVHPEGADPDCRAIGGYVRQVGSGQVRASVVGRGTIEYDLCVGPFNENDELIIRGWVRIVAANGDELTMTAVGTFSVVRDPPSTNALVLTGGTGRFASATGTLVMNSSGEGVPVSSVSGTLDGSIQR
jgi:hypothetical protein